MAGWNPARELGLFPEAVLTTPSPRPLASLPPPLEVNQAPVNSAEGPLVDNLSFSQLVNLVRLDSQQMGEHTLILLS